MESHGSVKCDDEAETKDYKVNCETVRTNLEVSPQKRPLSRAPPMFYTDFSDANGDKSKIKTIWGALQVSCHAEVCPTGGRELAVKHETEREGHVQEGWKMFPEVLKQVCTDFNETLFDPLLEES